MSVTLKDYTRLHDHMILIDHPTENPQTTKVTFGGKRWTSRPSSGLICSLWALCIALLFLVIVVLIVTVTGQTEQNIEGRLSNLSLGMDSRVERLSQDDHRTLEKLTAIETSMGDLKDSKDSLSRDTRKILGEMDRLAEEIRKGRNSGMTEKLSAIETLMKNLKGQHLDEMKQNLEVKFRNLSMEMNSVMDQLTQDDSKIMQKLSSMKNSMKDLNDQWLREMEQNMATKLRNLSMEISSRVDQLPPQDDFRLMEKLSSMETLMKDLKGQWLYEMEQNMELQLRNLSMEMHSVVGQLTQNDSNVMEKLSDIDTSMKNLNGQRLDKMEQNMEVQLRNLSMEMHSLAGQLSQDDSRMMEKLSVMETSIKDLKGQWLDELRKNMNMTIEKRSMDIRCREDHLSQDGFRIMEKLSTMETSMKALTGQRLEDVQQNMDVKLGNLSMGVQSLESMLSQDDSKVMKKLFALETSIMELNGPLSKNVPTVVGNQAEEIQKIKSALSSDIQKIQEALQKQTVEIQKANPSRVLSKVTEIESLVKRVLPNDAIGSLSRDVKKVLESVNKMAGEIQKVQRSGEPCSTGWINFGGKCYYWSSNSIPWNSAKKQCEDRQAHLVVVNGNDEMVFLRAFSQKKLWWIGLTEIDNTWHWVDDTSFELTPKFWEPGQPDNYANRALQGGEDCAQLRGTNGWNDAHCSAKHFYICEKKML
ncbi:C-type lectin domain family 4 member F-like isoform X2 [Rana temporaria]|uniref:C-type lectin domain family 4 member F-like isoform X2 n=1 Tax=Rana temporaria TaxID=8407 RepID=UPI001AADA0B8|nr:C-type lectin domain family 4 member F-like isoform X2 [Rana temporaria]